MFSPLTRQLIETRGYALVDETNVDAFLDQTPYAVLFFPGDAERLAESDDVAVVLPELIKTFDAVITPAIVARGEAERALQRRFRFNAFPTLVFTKRQGYLGAISRVQDWNDYVRETADIITREPTDPPTYSLPEGCATTAEANKTTHAGGVQ